VAVDLSRTPAARRPRKVTAPPGRGRSAGVLLAGRAGPADRRRRAEARARRRCRRRPAQLLFRPPEDGGGEDAGARLGAISDRRRPAAREGSGGAAEGTRRIRVVSRWGEIRLLLGKTVPSRCPRRRGGGTQASASARLQRAERPAVFLRPREKNLGLLDGGRSRPGIPGRRTSRRPRTPWRRPRSRRRATSAARFSLSTTPTPKSTGSSKSSRQLSSSSTASPRPSQVCSPLSPPRATGAGASNLPSFAGGDSPRWRNFSPRRLRLGDSEVGEGGRVVTREPSFSRQPLPPCSSAGGAGWRSPARL
jgi:hypothetical protein